jgi:hypothetical protein
LSRLIGKRTAVKAEFLLDAVTAASRRVYNPLSTSSDSAYAHEVAVPIDAITSATEWVRSYPPAPLDSPAIADNGYALSVDAVTAASASELRNEYGAGLSHNWVNTLMELFFRRSDENDYHSNSGSLKVKQHLFKKNSQVNFSYTRYDDNIEPKKSSPSYHLKGNRIVNNFNLGWAQTLTPRTLGMVAFESVFSNGLLGRWDNPDDRMMGRLYYSVLVEDTVSSENESSLQGGAFYWESYPETKQSHAGLVKIRQHYPSIFYDGSAQLEYRRYWDTWGVSANTYALTLYQYLHERIYLQLRYRYYHQTPAAFYRNRYNLRHVNPDSPKFLSYITVDPRLSDFDSHLFQARIVFVLNPFHKITPEKSFGFLPTRVDIEVQRYLRSTHADLQIRTRRYEYYGKEGLQAWVVRGGMVFSY